MAHGLALERRARSEFGFTGVVISDGLGATKQVASVPVGQRATRFIAAGGDLILTVDVSQPRPWRTPSSED